MMHIAVVILNYNGEKLLRQFLPSVLANSGDASVIVADNGSTDQSVALLEKEFPTVTIIRLEDNYGFCKGYNKALQQVTADIYILLNSDVAVTPDWLTPLRDLFVHDADIDAVQPKILSYRERTRFEYAGAGGGFIDALGYPFCRGRLFDYVEEDHGQYNDERPIFWATGACLAIRATTYHELGGLDEDFFAHMEEIDLCWRIHRTGHKVYYTGKSTVYHLGAGTLAYNSPRKIFLNFRNNLVMLLKHYGTGELMWKLPVRFMLDWLAALVFLLKGEAGSARAVFQAHLAFMKNIKGNYGKRRRLHRAYPAYAHTQIFKGLILIERRIRKKKIIVM